MRGIAHIGVLRRLEEEGIRINTISGSSMGALIGSLYSLGYDTYELENIIKEADADEVFQNKPERDVTENYLKKTADRTVVELEFTENGIEIPNALNNGHRVLKRLRDLVFSSEYYTNNFNELKCSLRVVCSDVQNGQKVVFSEGDLPTIILGSISFPGLFKPVIYKDMKLLDGGLTDNLPTGVLDGCDFIIASNMTHDTPSKDEEYNFIELLDRISLTMTRTNIEKSLGIADIVLSPELHDIRFGEIENPDSLIAIGYREADRNIEKIRELIGKEQITVNKTDNERNGKLILTGNVLFSDSDLVYEINNSADGNEAALNITRKYRNEGYILSETEYKKGRETDTLMIDEGILNGVDIKGNIRTKGSFIRNEISVSLNSRLRINDIEDSVDNLYGSGLFSRVSYSVDYVRNRVTFVLEEKPYSLVRIGANYKTDRGFLGLIELSNKNIHGKRAEIYGGITYGEKFNRLEFSYYNPFLKRSTLFFEIQPYAQIREREFYSEEYRKLPELTFKERRAGVNLNVGFQFFDNYQGTAGLIQEKIEFKNEYYDRSSMVFSILADSRNDHIVASKGVFFSWNMESGMIDFDNDLRYQKIWWEMSVYGRFLKRLNVELGVCAGTGDNLVPDFERYLRGGISMMPGTFFGQFPKTQYFTVRTKQNFMIRKSVLFDTYITTGYYLNGFWDSPDIEWSYRDFTNSFHAGFLLNTKLVPIETGWGITLGNGNIKANNRFYFSIGFSLI
ncbi:MAG: patatin-like phospholipase family protein [Candidatus Delongbacteria bacterium]|nr:patatin-like phospholipase family protein [Candidatus Delongbacteria bacterium]